MRKILTEIIKIYQKSFSYGQGFGRSFFLIGGCRFYPSCSEYTRQAIEKYGPLKGGWMGLKRVLRCHPFGGSGYDPLK